MYITFYSYKGGVGRTMALANVACLLAQDEDHPQRVLLIDLDLEAPGLHKLFPPDSGKIKGFVDLAYEFSGSSQANINLDEYIYKSDVEGIDILPAGDVGVDYCRKLESLYWPGFLSDDPKQRGPFFDLLVTQIDVRRYDYVLIDSRTGLSEQAGIATQLLSDLVLIIFRLTEQNLDGLSHLYTTTVAQLAARGRSHVRVSPVASVVMSKSSQDQDDRRQRVEGIFGVRHLSYIRFDPDLVAEEKLFSRKEMRIWPRPPVVEDYKRLCHEIRRGNPKDIKTAENQLQSKIHSDDDAAAYKILSGMLVSRPRSERVWHYLYAHNTQFRNRLDSSDELAAKILNEDPSNSFAREWLASKALADIKSVESDQIACAEELLLGAVKDNSSSYRLFRKLSDLYSLKGDLAKAADMLRKSIECASNNVGLRLRLARLFVRRGRDYFVSSVELLKEIEGPSRFPLMAYLASLLGTAEEADDAVKKTYDLELDRERHMGILAHCLVLQGKNNEAMGVADMAIAEPDKSVVLNWAELYLCARQYEKVFTLLEDVPAEQSCGLISLAKYIKSKGHDIDADKVAEAWLSLGSWDFTELLFFRERLMSDQDADLNKCLPIFERLIRNNILSSIVHDPDSLFWRRSAQSIESRMSQHVRATFRHHDDPTQRLI